MLVTLARYGSPGEHLLAVSFPFDEGLRAIVRDVPGRRWLEKQRQWVMPDNPESVLKLKRDLERVGHAITMTPDVKAYLNATYNAAKQAHAIREAGDADVKWPLRTTPYAHQRAGLAFLTKLDGGALLWEMGLGKTAATIAFAETLGPAELRGGGSPLRFLVICPNTIRRNWGAEIEKHAGHSDYVIPDGDYRKRLPLLGTRRYTILNTEALSHPQMAPALAKIDWDLVVVDESTRFKGPKAARTKALLKLRAKRRVILTGTPITNTAEDAWAPFEFVSPGLFGSSFFAFVDRYLVKDYFGKIEGIKPERADELRARIDSRSYRILKADVLDLPPKVYVDRTVELDGEQKRLYADMRDTLRVAYEGGDIEAFNVLTQLLRLTQITAGMVGEGDRYTWLHKGNAKLAELDALYDEMRNEPFVVFGLYQEELRQLALRYTPPRSDLPIIYGPTPEKDRARFIDQFQAGAIPRLFIQTRTGGLGINLTAARTAVYYTRGWSLEDYLQSQDRLHRIGQTGTVTIVHLVAEGTVDVQITKALAAKSNLADNLTGDVARKLAREVLGVKER